MKLAGAAAVRYFAKPDPARLGLLIYGADAMRVALRRQEVIAALVGPEGEAEMRLTRMSGADLRKAPSTLRDGIKEIGFFPGLRVMFVEEATDGTAPAFDAAIKAWSHGDAVIVATAGQLTAKSALRKVFENHPNAYAIGIYDDPPSREEIEEILKKAGLRHVPPEAMADLVALAKALDPGDFRQTIEKIALYKHGDTTPLTAVEIALSTPSTVEAEVDDLLDLVADGRPADLVAMMRRIEGQGVLPVTLAIMATRHFRTLHMVAADPGGPGAGIGKLRYGAGGPRREIIQRQAGRWGMMRLEEALKTLIEADLTLRSASKAPQMAVMERALLRLASIAAKF